MKALPGAALSRGANKIEKACPYMEKDTREYFQYYCAVVRVSVDVFAQRIIVENKLIDCEI